MKRSRIRTATLLAAGLALVAPPAARSEQPDAGAAAMREARTPGDQHAYLARQAGTWKVTLSVWADASAPPAESAGVAMREVILDGRVLRETLTAKMMGMPFRAVGHVGFDNVTGRYWTTSFDDFSTGVTVLNGSIDESTGSGTLVGETPEPTAGRMVPMRLEIYERDGKQVMDSYRTIGGEEVMPIRVVYERP